MYGASIAQMKAACSAVPECEGFNSDGWVKSRISQKKRSTIDLYLKQVVTAELPSQVYNDWESFWYVSCVDFLQHDWEILAKSVKVAILLC